MSTDSNLILCNCQRQFPHPTFFLHKKSPHPLRYNSETIHNSKIFTPTTMKFLKRSLMLTLPLLLVLPPLCHIAVLHQLRHLFTMTRRSIVLTLPLLISSHMLMSLIVLVNVFLLLLRLQQTMLPRERARAQARSPLSVPNLLCPKSHLTRFQF